MPVLLETEAVSLVYHDGDRSSWAVREATVQIPDRQFIGIMGPSGSGKSSMLYLLSGLKRPTSGDVRHDGVPYSRMTNRDMVDLRRMRFGFVFQQPYLLAWQTALENVLMGAPVPDRAALERADMYFDHLGIAGLRDKLPPQLSGGEKQRVCVARAMMNEPRVIFADEPTASLDHTNGRLVIDLLSSYRDRGTVIVVTHDPEMLAGADNVLVMRDGECVGWKRPSRAPQGVGLDGAEDDTVSVVD
ncbi:MAG: ABC transporter ATP-binding protein [Capsulimonadaceae bacterium]